MENAGAAKHPGFYVAITIGFGPTMEVAFIVVFPFGGIELIYETFYSLKVVITAEVRTEGTTAHIRSFLVDTGASLAENACPAGCEPGEIAAEHFVRIVRVRELDKAAREAQ